jgi:hypothetical protein
MAVRDHACEDLVLRLNRVCLTWSGTARGLRRGARDADQQRQKPRKQRADGPGRAHPCAAQT